MKSSRNHLALVSLDSFAIFSDWTRGCSCLREDPLPGDGLVEVVEVLQAAVQHCGGQVRRIRLFCAWGVATKVSYLFAKEQGWNKVGLKGLGHEIYFNFFWMKTSLYGSNYENLYWFLDCQIFL